MGLLGFEIPNNSTEDRFTDPIPCLSLAYVFDPSLLILYPGMNGQWQVTANEGTIGWEWVNAASNRPETPPNTDSLIRFHALVKITYVSDHSQP